MERLLAVSSKYEYLAVIRYYTVLNDSARDINTNLTEVYGNAVSYDIVKRWRRLFLNGCTELNDEMRTGRPSVITKDTINTFCPVVEQDRRVTVTKIERYFREVSCDALSHGTVLTIIHDHLGV